MPIKQPESGLTVEQYNKLTDPDRIPAWKVIAKRYNLKFDVLDLSNNPPFNNKILDFNSIDIEDENVIAHVVNGKIYVVTSDGTEMQQPEAVPGYGNVARNCSLFNADSSLRVYWAEQQSNGNGLIRVAYYQSVTRTQINYTSTGSIGVALNENEIISHIAAASNTRIHYVVQNTARKTYNLRCVEYTGSWQHTSSDIHWSYPIQSFDAATDGNMDVIVISSQMPGIFALKTEAEKVTKKLEPAGGVSCFTYKYNTWSDHIEVDVIDNVQDYRLRKNPRINYINNLFCITAFSKNGSSQNSFSSYRLYTSKNGFHWSMGTALPLPINITPNSQGLCLIHNNDYVYALGNYSVWRSDASYELELSSDQTEENLTDDILDLSISHDKTMQINIELDNSDGKYTDHYFINEENTIALEIYTGVYDDDGTPILIKIGTAEVETLNLSYDPTSRTLNMQARNRISWINDKTQAEEAKFWQGQLQGADNYSDFTDTGFGGLGHTAVQTGTWAIENNKLALQTSNDASIAFSSFSPYITNGSYRTSFSLSKKDNNEEVGIIFRAVDKGNFMMARYYQNNFSHNREIYSGDRIALQKIVGGAKYALSVPTPPLGWANNIGETYHMMVEFKYGLIKVYTSNSGRFWDLAIEYIDAGANDPNNFGSIVFDKGYVGFWARGYSDSSGWNQNTAILDSTIRTSVIDFDSDVIYHDTQVIDSDTVFTLPFIEGDITNDSVEYSPIIAWNNSGTGAFSPNLNEENPVWQLIDPPNGRLLSMCLDYSSQYPIFGTGKLGAYCVAFEQIEETQHFYVYFIDDLFATEKVYDLLYTFTDDSILEIDHAVIVQSETNFQSIGITIKRRVNPIVIWTTDNWATSSTHILESVYDNEARKTTAWFNNYGKYLTILPYYINSMENDGRIFVFNTEDGTYIEKTSSTPSYSSPHIAKLDDFGIWNFITENIGYNQDNNSPYDMSYFYDSMNLSDEEFNAISEETRWERTAGTTWTGYQGVEETATIVPYESDYGLVAYAEDTYAYPDTVSRVCRVELNYNFLDPYSIKRVTFKARYHDTCCSNTNTFNSTLTITGQSNDGPVEVFATETYTSTNLDLITFEAVIDVHDVTALTFQLDSIRTQDMSGTAQVWVDDIMFTLMNEDGEEVIEDTDNGVIFISSNYNSDDASIANLNNVDRPIVYNEQEFSRVSALSSSRNYRSSCLAICKTEDGTDFYIAYTSNQGFNWDLKLITATELDAVYLSPERFKYIYGDEKIEYFTGSSASDLSGNLDDIWPLNWTVVGMETL